MTAKQIILVILLSVSITVSYNRVSYASVNVCNKTRYDVWITSARSQGFFGWSLSGWYLVKSGRCNNSIVGMSRFDAEPHMFGFIYEDPDLGWAARVVPAHKLTSYSWSSRPIAALEFTSADRNACVRKFEAFRRSGSAAELARCPDGNDWIKIPLSWFISPYEDDDYTLNIAFSQNDRVIPLDPKSTTRSKSTDSRTVVVDGREFPASTRFARIPFGDLYYGSEASQFRTVASDILLNPSLIGALANPWAKVAELPIHTIFSRFNKSLEERFAELSFFGIEAGRFIFGSSTARANTQGDLKVSWRHELYPNSDHNTYPPSEITQTTWIKNLDVAGALRKRASSTVWIRCANKGNCVIYSDESTKSEARSYLELSLPSADHVVHFLNILTVLQDAINISP